MRAFFPDAITVRRAGWFDKQGEDEEKRKELTQSALRTLSSLRRAERRGEGD
jgi:hypothetical protein